MFMLDQPFTPLASRPVVINNGGGEKLQGTRSTTSERLHIRGELPQILFTGFHGRLGGPMESIFLWIALGFVAGYMVRALISQVRRRRFEEDYGFNPRIRLKPRP
jgi:hypothetical protein